MLHQAVFSPLIFLCTKMDFSLLIFVHKMGPSLLTFWTKMWFLVLIFVRKNGLFPLNFVHQRWGFSSLFFFWCAKLVTLLLISVHQNGF